VTWVAPALLLVVLATSAGTGQAARPSEPSVPRARANTLGQLLVATDDLHDPRFARSVVYMLRHDAAGALGLVVNRPVGTLPLARVLESLGREHAHARGEIRMHYGGPVEPGRGFVLHTREWRNDETRVVHGDIAVTSDPAVFDALGRGIGPRRALFVAGYAGWAPGQLEAEIEHGFWLVVDADEALIFDEDAATKWERATQRRKIAL
jgi:putative transcriptional regulator